MSDEPVNPDPRHPRRRRRGHRGVVTVVSPPAVAAWDVDQVAARALAILRLEVGDVDESRIRGDAQAACALVDAWVDHCESGTPPTSTMLASAVDATINLYRGGVAASFPGTPGPLDGSLSIAGRDRQRFGVS